MSVHLPHNHRCRVNGRTNQGQPVLSGAGAAHQLPRPPPGGWWEGLGGEQPPSHHPSKVLQQGGQELQVLERRQGDSSADLGGVVERGVATGVC